MEVKIETKITQVKDNSKYKGYLKIGRSTLDWEFTFPIPISRLDAELPKRQGEPIQKLFQVTVQRNNREVPLTDDEYKLFVRLLLMEIVKFYNLPQTRDSNEGTMGSLVRREDPLGSLASVEISTILNGTYTLPEEICATLNQPKFDCALAA